MKGDPRATVDALLKDRKRLCEQLATAPACISNGYTRGWLPGDEFEGWMITSETSSFPGFVSEHVRAANEVWKRTWGCSFQLTRPHIHIDSHSLVYAPISSVAIRHSRSAFSMSSA